MIENFKETQKRWLYDIDIKSYYWPWTEQGWHNLMGYIFRVYCLKGVPRGFSCFKMGNSSLEVVKLCVHPTFRRLGFGSLLNEDLIHTAISQKKSKLCMIIHEQNEYFDWLKNRGWNARGIERGLFPDGTDGFCFERAVVN
ncbi:hypothetical protein LCGC14_1407410 [marine sediment metagenome]|uniref:N-acetyltransferase domain-containing protein n=1 Tax=marine sediment metagenome TaxID=412755 RepID=A0A0F9JV92_9ZZZZ